MSAASLAAIVRALGGDLYAGGRRANVPGPGHSAADRSVSLALSGRRVLVHCFAGDDWRAVLDELRRRGLVDAQGRLLGGDDAPRTDAPPIDDRPGPRVRRTAALRLWAESRPADGTLAERHLRRRHVRGAIGRELRFHPSVPAAVYAGRGPRRPALLTAIRAPAGEIVGVEVTYLAPNGERARLAVPRKTIGLCPAGSAVRLAPPEPRLLVAEGVVTALSAGERFGLPAWALLSVRNLAQWAPPAGVEAVLIAADRGAPGEAAAAALRARLAVRGLACAVALPPPAFGDWNEAQAAGWEPEEGRGGAGAAGGWSGPPAPEGPGHDRSPCPDPP